jgi:hypothetical protein
MDLESAGAVGAATGPVERLPTHPVARQDQLWLPLALPTDPTANEEAIGDGDRVA